MKYLHVTIIKTPNTYFTVRNSKANVSRLCEPSDQKEARKKSSGVCKKEDKRNMSYAIWLREWKMCRVSLSLLVSLSLSHPIHGTKLANQKKGEIRQNDALPRIAARYIRNWDYYTNIDMEWTTRNNSIQTFSIHTFSRWWFGCHIERVTLSLSLALSLGFKCAISNLIHTIIHLGDENENSPAIFAVFVNRLETRAIFWTGKRVYHAENSLLRSINLDILLPTTRRIRFQPKWRCECFKHMPFFSSQYQKDSEIR